MTGPLVVDRSDILAKDSPLVLDVGSGRSTDSPPSLDPAPGVLVLVLDVDRLEMYPAELRNWELEPTLQWCDVSLLGWRSNAVAGREGDDSVER